MEGGGLSCWSLSPCCSGQYLVYSGCFTDGGMNEEPGSEGPLG